MACKKSEIVTAINSFVAATSTKDAALINYAGATLSQLLDSLEFEPEEPTEVTPTEVVE
jgi:hypothetical protein